LLSKKVSSVGFCTGAVCGLVAITPASGFVTVWASIVIGMFSGLLPNLFCRFKIKYDLFDDALDVFGCHGIAGLVGSILTGFFASNDVNDAGPNGAVYGNGSLLWKQIVVSLVVGIWSFGMSFLILTLMKITIGLRVNEEEEKLGIDRVTFGEEAVNFSFFDELRKVKTEVELKGIFSYPSMKTVTNNIHNDGQCI